MIVIPAIDLRDGRVVRLRQGDFAQTRTFDADPIALADAYAQAGAQWLHVVDLDGARAGAPQQLALVESLARIVPNLQTGGGVRSEGDLQRLLDAGASRVVVGSVAVREPDTVGAWIARFGADRICVALDLHLGEDGRWRPALDAWQSSSDTDFATLVERLRASGLRHVLSTDIAQDGMRDGPNFALYRILVARWPSIDWIASGGVRDRADVETLAQTGVAGCVAGTALLEGTLTLEELAACSRAA